MNRQERIQRTPRRRPDMGEVPPLQGCTYAPDTSDAAELIDRIAAILEML